MTQFGQRDGWVRDLHAGAGQACLDDAGVDADAIIHHDRDEQARLPDPPNETE